MTNCIVCDREIEHAAARKGRPASWRCPGCGRAGDYAQGLRRDGTVFTARVERVPPDPERSRRMGLRPWVLAESVPYERRVAA